MSSALDRSLDDIMSSKREVRRSREPRRGDKRGRGRGRGSFVRRRRSQGEERAPRVVVHNPSLQRSAPRDLRKVKVSNLELDILSDELFDVFKNVQGLKSCEVVLDRSGKSRGFACLWFTSDSDARHFIKNHNGVPLNDRDMVVTFWETEVSSRPRALHTTPRSAKPSVSAYRARDSERSFDRPRPSPKKQEKPLRKEKAPKPTAEELDAELDAYLRSE